MTSKKSVHPRDRLTTLSSQQTLKMARSAHAYVRGSTIQFYEWLEAQKRGSLPEGPPVWICGDCHAGNLGPLAGNDGQVAIQIRDLDQTVIGNPAHDLIRLALSLATAARGSDLPGVTTAHILEHAVQGYQAALRQDPEQIEPAPECVRVVMKRSVGRSWRNLAKERLTDEKPTIPKGSKFWPISVAEKELLRELFKTNDLREMVTSLRSRESDARIDLVDAAYWMKGCSSLGKLRFAVLLAIGGKKQNELALMDVKEAITAIAPRYKDQSMPKGNGARVVEGARHLSPNLGRRIVAGRLESKSVFIRELMPQDLKIEIDQMTIEEATRAASFLAAVVGKAHARQLNERARNKWAQELERNRSKSLDAPSWLWTSVVALIGKHETAYLEHCRRYQVSRTT